MKPDLYTKSVLTVIAVALCAIACNQYISPPVTAQAQGNLTGVQFTGSVGGSLSAIDTRSGELWSYETIHQGSKYIMRVSQSGRLTKLGAEVPLTDR